MSSKPQPIPDSETQVFWDAARENRLKIQKCNSCKNHIFYPRLVCHHCMSDDLDWVTVSGSAKIYALTHVHKAVGPFKPDLPFLVALVELAEGPRMMTRILSDEPDQVQIGDSVTVEFQAEDEGMPLPYFRAV